MIFSKKIILSAFFIAIFLSTIPNIFAEPSNDNLANVATIEQNQSTPDTEQNSISAAKLLHNARPKDLHLKSSVALVFDDNEDVILYERNIDEQRPIASLTKLMMAMVCLDADLALDEKIKIVRADRDRLRNSTSRLKYGTLLSRQDLLLIALAASENRAAYAIARTYPGGKKSFVVAMNKKAQQLGMTHTHFKDPAGLNSDNVSTARDLVKLVNAAQEYALIVASTTEARGSVTDLRSGWEIEFMNTNRLVRKKSWNIGLSKTGYIADAGNCLVMQTEIANRPVIIVLLNSWGKLSKFGDSNRIKNWLLKTEKKIKHQQELDLQAQI